VFRRLLGYLRYDKEEEKNLLEQIYLLSGLDYNFFQPNMKLVSRERIGSRVIKRHGLPKNPLPGIIRIARAKSGAEESPSQNLPRAESGKVKDRIERLKDKLWRIQKTKKNCTNFRTDSYVRQSIIFHIDFLMRQQDLISYSYGQFTPT